ncbi:MAG: type IV toxin-antitoxin system AbiEi family antitoxin domain-containing protein [Candidatus Woesearchaeota archaeon]
MSKNNDISSLSQREVRIIQELEFNNQYFFTQEDIKHHATNKQQLYYIIHRLLQKKRILKLNKNKYYLLPIQAPNNTWYEHEFIIADEMMNSQDYFIGGWAAANYYNLTDQIPQQVDIYTNKRNNTTTILNTRYKFKKTTKKRLQEAQNNTIQGHNIRIEPKEKTKQWMKKRNV